MPNILHRITIKKRGLVTFNPGVLPKKNKKIKKCISSNKSFSPVKLLLPYELINPSIQLQMFFSGQTITHRHHNIIRLKNGINILNSNKILSIHLTPFQNNINILEEYIKKEQNIRTMLKRFIQLWLYKKYKSRKINKEDPATLCEPVKPIYIYDNKVKGTYTFEASTLCKSIETNLTFTDWMFPQPIKPKNSFTNISFSDTQLYEITKQLRRYNIASWWLEAYIHLKMDINIFECHHHVSLKINNLNSIFRDKKGDEYIEYLSDFIDRYYNIHEINTISQLLILKWGVTNLIDDPYMQKWSSMMYEFMKIKIINNIPESDIDNPLYDNIYTSTYIHFMKNSEIARIGRIRLLSITKNRRIDVTSPE